jgi:hypothetical protein
LARGNRGDALMSGPDAQIALPSVRNNAVVLSIAAAIILVLATMPLVAG